MNYTIYLLINTLSNHTYIGSTNNLNRRIRQHNKELVGGAKYTTNYKGNGEWMYYGYIKNLEKCQSLSIEKKIQIKTRKVCGKTPLLRRLKAIELILQDYEKIIFEFAN
jgi:predicted GIY-YIG superfamily endonuclease